MSYAAMDADNPRTGGVREQQMAGGSTGTVGDGLADPDVDTNQLLRQVTPAGAPVDSTARRRKRLRYVAIVASLLVLGAVVAILYAVLHKSHSDAPITPAKPGMSPSERACQVFCTGPLLAAVQLAYLYNDSKTFVDKPLKVDPEDALVAFHKLGANPSKGTLQAFVDEYFAAVGSDVKKWTPTDYTHSPPLLSHIVNASVAQWAADVNKLWLVLGRKVGPDVLKNPQRHSLLPLPMPTIVPGGRFRETYYWDTYWIVKGLIACNMTTTAKYLIINLLAEASINGYVPNGARVYYLQRSQPPVLTLIINEYLEATGDVALVKSAMGQLETAHEWWMRTGSTGRAVKIPNPSDPDHPYTLNRYVGTVPEPRPESYTVDIDTAAQAGYAPGSAERGHLFEELRAAAETGWDFSSRWFKNHATLDSVWTSNVLAVDLNSILYKVEKHMARFYRMFNNETFAAKYDAFAADRAEAMRALMWNTTANQWYDVYISTQKQTGEDTAANWVPLWANLFTTSPDYNEADILAALQSSPLIQQGGILTTNLHTGQQWDSPNAWAPLQHMIIMGLRNMTTPDATAFAKELSRRWLFTNFAAYQKAPFMYEKYDAFEPGHGGGGGEYIPQVGFGWTNGVALDLLRKYGAEFTTLDPVAADGEWLVEVDES